ncbi:HD-GYP domain-containing protein [Sphingobium chlorophenolicum]|uniref:Metal dependent phosphohydrolase n=1 Tax=Sphingobium chlorophenolicum TaxID=46429 RepID=A0A081RF34_SPHCR|nr:HD-GYP domain-containing protein [Sphingobium chlorophenolicum]KEQ53807.1 Metal dependent phosphohydrolase [Sphingobium chlorophenolicum]
MLKRIRTQDVELGMFLHKMEGSWFSHPFWKSRMLLDDGDQLETLKASKVEWVQIDTSRGIDLKPAPPPSRPVAVPDQRERTFGRAGASARRAPAPVSRPFDPLSKERLSTKVEMVNANRLARKSVRAMQKIFDDVRLGKAIKLTKLEPMIEEISCSIQRNPHAFMAVTRLKNSSEYLYLHALTVCTLMISLAQQLRLSPEQVQQAGLAGLLMDVGMGHVPQETWDKNSPLTPEEWEVVKSHTTLAHEFLTLGGEMPEAVLDVCLHHHERLDGSGYPHGLKGDEIGLFARMAAICDTYDAMTSNRIHRHGEDPSRALLMLDEAQTLYDPEIFQAFQQAVGIYPIGSLVRLRSHRLAIVVEQNRDDLTLPVVRPFYSLNDRCFVKAEDIDLSNCFGADQIMTRETPEGWDMAEWPALSAKLLAAAG